MPRHSNDQTPVADGAPPPQKKKNKSQKKRNLTNEKARLRNNAYKSELKTLIRKVNDAIGASDKAAAESNLRIAARKLDKAVSKGVIHKNQAANRKSKIAKRAASL